MKPFKAMILLSLTVIAMCSWQSENKQITSDKTIVAESDSVAILSQIVDSAKDEYDIPEVAIWIREKASGRESLLYQTVRPDWYCWYMADGDRFCPDTIDSIPATSRVVIYNENPLQLIVEGCPDMRNIFSFFIDVPTRKTWYVPANKSYVGKTSEEGYMMFQSYRYVSDPDIAGRYTFLQVFDKTGNMVDSPDLEHVKLEHTRNEETDN